MTHGNLLGNLESLVNVNEYLPHLNLTVHTTKDAEVA